MERLKNIHFIIVIWLKTKKKLYVMLIDPICSKEFHTSEEVFLGIDEVVIGFVDLNLTLPCLRHVPHTRVAGYHMELQ